MSEEEILFILKSRLSLRTTSGTSYTGGMNGSDSLYRDVKYVQLCLDDEVISEIEI